MKKNYIGIDEAGRGPWAGPLVVAGVLCTDESILKNIAFLTDSKKLSPQKREKIFDELHLFQNLGKIKICTQTIEASEIDILGIRNANKKAMERCIQELCQFKNKNEIYIDGADNFVFESLDVSYFFAKKKNQKKQIIQKSEDCVKNTKIYFQISGDATNILISSASIIAKVTRDRIMKLYGKIFPQYGFEEHKGYGTRKHRDAILYYGITSLHRKSYRPIKTLISQTTGLV